MQEKYQQMLIDENLRLRYESLLRYNLIYQNTKLRILLHYPNNGAIKYLVDGWQMILDHMGVPVLLLPFGHNFKDTVDYFRPNVFITCADPYYLSNIDSDYLVSKGVKIGHMSSMWEKMYSPCDFIVDFFLEGPQEREGIPVKRVRFGANPIIHYASEMRTDWDYFFVGTNSSSKTLRTREFLEPIVKRYDGLLMGTGWNLPPYNKHCTELPITGVPPYYAISKVSPNFHQLGQIEHYINVNERTYIIPACLGFEIVDRPKALDDVFERDEMVSAENPSSYFDQVTYFIKHPEERLEYIGKAMRRVYEQYTLFHSMTDLVQFLEKLL